MVIGEQGPLVVDLELPVAPDGGGQGEQPLADADEDSAEDAALALEELRRGGFECISRRVQTREAMEAALAEKWDVILSDFQVPGFGALPALALLIVGLTLYLRRE